MVPTLHRTLGVKGHRPIVGNDDNKDCVYLFGSLNLVTGHLTTNILKWPRKKKDRTATMQQTFVKHLKQVLKKYPGDKKIVITIDRASWHRGKLVKQFLEKHSRLELYELPSYSPCLQVIERFWKILRRRATHNRFFSSMENMRKTLQSNIQYYQVMKRRLLSIICSPRKRAKAVVA